jgi:uncharacterized repeat protein (TIGR03803 family)
MVLGVLAFMVLPLAGAQAYTHKILYSFCAKAPCTDGAVPYGNLAMDATGAVFGTTGQGGKHNVGSVFKLTPNANKTKWKLQTLYSFCTKTDCADGWYPNGGLVIDTDGNLYGTTYYGGAAGSGLVFKLSPVVGKPKWKLIHLHDFVGGTDGVQPTAGLTYAGAQSGAQYDGVSPLYGTTSGGGGEGAEGTVFSISPGRAKWKETVLHAFTSGDGTNLSGQLMIDAPGNLYGTAPGGGSSGAGTVFELSPNLGKTRWSISVLYNFCPTLSCTDGLEPQAGVVMGASGDLFGTTELGGAANDGVAFKIVPNGGNSQETVLYDFCSKANCVDGSRPEQWSGSLAFDASGNMFGATQFGGGHNIDMNFEGGGVVFELNGTQSVLYAFCAESYCADGEYPSSNLLLDGSGNLIGSTSWGGAYGAGTIYELTP